MPWMRYSTHTLRRNPYPWNHISFPPTKRVTSWIEESFTIARLPCRLHPKEERSAWDLMQMERLQASTAVTDMVAETVPMGDDSEVARTKGDRLGRETESAALHHGLPKTDLKIGTTLTIGSGIGRPAIARQVVGQISIHIFQAMDEKKAQTTDAGMMTGLGMIVDALPVRTVDDGTIEIGERGVEAARPCTIGLASERFIDDKYDKLKKKKKTTNLVNINISIYAYDVSHMYGRLMTVDGVCIHLAPPLCILNFMISQGNSFSSTPFIRIWTGVGGDRIKNWKGVNGLRALLLACLLAAAKIETERVSITIENAIAQHIYN